jgi:subtilisin family serine protease
MSYDSEDSGPSSVPTIDSKSHLWALLRCGFPKAWEILEPRGDADPGPIAIIDVGNGGLDHPSIEPRIEKYVGPQSDASSASHAASVAGVIAAIDDLPDMIGACSAKLHVYNAWTSAGFDRRAFLDALADVATSGARVLNLSVGSPERDDEIGNAIQKCIDAGVVVVAAMGDYAGLTNSTIYPADLPGVIAVGATNHHDRRRPESGIGDHISIAAPGEQIWTVVASDAYGSRDGTSFAAPLVAAAAWLVVRARPGATPAQIKALLEETADATNVVCPPVDESTSTAEPPRPCSVEIGHGRLDVAKLAERLNEELVRPPGRSREAVNTPVQVTPVGSMAR